MPTKLIYPLIRRKHKYGITILRMEISSADVKKDTLRRWAEEARELIIPKGKRAHRGVEVSLGVLRDNEKLTI